MSNVSPLRLRSHRRALAYRFAHAAKMANVGHILKAVGRKHIPRTINKQRLREDIKDALLGYDLAREFDDDALGKRRYKALSDLRRKAAALREALHGDESDWFSGRFSPRMGGLDADRRNSPSFRALGEGLDRLIALAEHDLGELVPPGRLVALNHSPLVYLVGELAAVFERRFGTGAGYKKDPYSDTDGDAKGPFIDFVQSVLDEANIKAPGGFSYSPNTISSALSQLRHAKSRRKRKP